MEQEVSHWRSLADEERRGRRVAEESAVREGEECGRLRRALGAAKDEIERLRGAASSAGGRADRALGDLDAARAALDKSREGARKAWHEAEVLRRRVGELELDRKSRKRREDGEEGGQDDADSDTYRDSDNDRDRDGDLDATERRAFDLAKQELAQLRERAV